MKWLALASLLVTGMTVPAGAYNGAEQDFLGVWRNLDRASPGVTRLEIRPDRGNTVFVRVWRRCRSGECELGSASGRIFYSRSERSRESDQAAILVRFNRDEVSGNVLVRLNPRGDIVTHALLSSQETGENTYAVERFQRSGEALADYDDDWRRRRH